MMKVTVSLLYACVVFLVISTADTKTGVRYATWGWWRKVRPLFVGKRSSDLLATPGEGYGGESGDRSDFLNDLAGEGSSMLTVERSVPLIDKLMKLQAGCERDSDCFVTQCCLGSDSGRGQCSPKPEAGRLCRRGPVTSDQHDGCQCAADMICVSPYSQQYGLCVARADTAEKTWLR